MKACLILFLMAAVFVTLSESVQFGLFNYNPSRTSTTQRPRSQLKMNFGLFQPLKELENTPAPLLNILQPVSSLLNAVGKTVESLLNLLVGGLRYRPYKRITTLAPPITLTSTTPYPYGTPPVFQVIITIPKNMTLTTTTTDSTVEDRSPSSSTTLEGPASEPSTTSSTIIAEPPTIPSTTLSTTISEPATEPSTTTTEPPTTSSTAIAEPATEPTTTTQASITEKGKPENVDWRRLNCFAPVRFQGQCRASFGFAVAASIETQICSKTGILTPLSTQNLIDCTKVAPFENSGCEGGALEPTFDYVVNVGINLDVDYPYSASDNKCRFMQEKSIGKIKDYMSIDEGDESTMEYVLNNVGPIAVGLDASQKSFVDYKEGIYYEPKCKSDIESLSHAVLLVGYGVEPDGQRYWLIRNSYGTTWGDKGYGKIARDPPNHCGISTYAVYPVVY